MNDVYRVARELEMVIDPLAAKLSKILLGDASDDISKREAMKRYGTAFIRRHDADGSLEYHVVGKRKMLSKAQLELLRSAEKITPYCRVEAVGTGIKASRII